MDLLLPFLESGPGKDPCVLQMFTPLSVIQTQLFLFKDVQKTHRSVCENHICPFINPPMRYQLVKPKLD